MIVNLKSYVERVVGRIAGDDAKARGPVPPKRVRPSIPAAKKPQASTPAAAKPRPEAKAAPKAAPRVLSRGHNKNVYVVARPDADENEIMRSVDSAPPLTTVEETGSDPYNSGIYNTKELWRRKD